MYILVPPTKQAQEEHTPICSSGRPPLHLVILLSVLCFLILVNCRPAVCEDLSGDRIAGTPKNMDDWVPSALPRESYCVEAGDTLNINVQGKANLDYHVRTPIPEKVDADEAVVTPDGCIYMPLIGKLAVTGKTVPAIEDLIRSKLSKYIRQFEVSVAVSKVRTVNVWISGEVANPGPQTVAAVSTVSLAALQAGVKPTGTTRRVTLTRGTTKKVVDLYKMLVTGDASEDIALKPGDAVHIPAVLRYVDITGQVMRPGRYEMVSFAGDAQTFRVRDLLEIAFGVVPDAALDKCYVERSGDDGKTAVIDIDLKPGSSSQDIVLQPGDRLVVPSISAYQPIIRLIGEFKGDGVYQRSTGPTKEDVQNKSGIYSLRRGQTVLDVITATGGVTPQADLKRARIERTENGSVKSMPLDLDRLLVMNDRTVDIALQTGDSLILPALADKVHVFGEIRSPGSFPFSPNRRLMDYLGDAGGPTAMAKLTDVSIVRGDASAPKVSKVNAKNSMRHGSIDGNPILEPGDIVYVPPKFLSDWRDGVQLIFTSLSLRSLLK